MKTIPEISLWAYWLQEHSITIIIKHSYLANTCVNTECLMFLLFFFFVNANYSCIHIFSFSCSSIEHRIGLRHTRSFQVIFLFPLSLFYKLLTVCLNTSYIVFAVRYSLHPTLRYTNKRRIEYKFCVMRLMANIVSRNRNIFRL